jgi:hypothetical protein
VLDDEVKVRNLLEIVLDALRAFIGAVLDDGLPALVPVEGDDVVYSRSFGRPTFDQNVMLVKTT